MAYSMGPGKIVEDGLIFYVDAANKGSYPGSGTPVTDLIGTNNGTISGATFTNTNAGVWDFDGVDDNIDFEDGIGNLIGNSYTGGLTFSFWINPDVTSGEDGIFSFPQDFTNGISLVLRSNSIRLYNNGQKASISYTNPNNEWSQCTLSFLPAGSVFYLDNVPVGTWTYTDLDLNGLDFYIGYYIEEQYSLNGKLSNFQIYNKALSASEVTQNYNALKGRFV